MPNASMIACDISLADSPRVSSRPPIGGIGSIDGKGGIDGIGGIGGKESATATPQFLSGTIPGSPGLQTGAASGAGGVAFAPWPYSPPRPTPMQHSTTCGPAWR